MEGHPAGLTPRRQKFSQLNLNLIRVFSMRLESIRPRSAGVKHIPRGTLLIISATARVVIAESIDKPVPKRREGFDQQGLAERNPNVIDHQVPAKEVFQIKISCLPY
jgi:hypothetical protein